MSFVRYIVDQVLVSRVWPCLMASSCRKALTMVISFGVDMGLVISPSMYANVRSLQFEITVV